RKIGFYEPGELEIRVRQVRPGEIGSQQVRVAQVGPGEVGAREVGADEVAFEKRSLAQYRVAKDDAFKFQLSESGSAEIGPYASRRTIEPKPVQLQPFLEPSPTFMHDAHTLFGISARVNDSL